MESGVSGGWVLVEARLQGGAPWGFTLQGGLEHGEPLIISKVEEGGKADCLEQPLLVGDEIIIINEVELTGYRQEAIVLIKGSYKTLQLIVRREFDPGYVEEFAASSCSLPASLSSSSPPPSQQQLPSPQSGSGSAGGVHLRIKSRRSEPASRPHSWHSTKLSEGQQEPDKDEMDTVTSAWHHGFHASALTADMSGGFDTSVSYLRKSPDQYSSRGSMESLDHHHSSQLPSAAQHLHLGHPSHSGPHRVYSSCQQLSSARSSNSIDHLHSKRDSAYSSFSTSSSIPEYLASTPSFSSERSYSLETVPQRGGGSGELQADTCYVQTVSDAQKGSQERQLSSDSRGGGGQRPSQDEGPGGGVCYRGSGSGSVPASNRHSVGPIWGPAASCSSYECLKGAPAPPRRSDSYAAIRNHERPNSWSSLEQARSLRTLQKGSWHHSSGHLASGAGKGSYSTDGQLHTVIEKSPESSPTTRPRQSGGFHPPSPPELSPTGPGPQSKRLILPTGMYPVLQPEPHYAQMPSSNHGPPSSATYPALTRQNSQQHQDLQGMSGRDDGGTEGQRDGRATQNGYHANASSAQASSPTASASQLLTPVVDRPPKEDFNFGHYKPCVKTGGGCAEGQTGTLRHHQESTSQSLHGSSIQTSHEHNQDVRAPHIQSTTGPRSRSNPEQQDSFTAQSRSMERPSIHADQAVFSRLNQEQSTHQLLHPQPQATPSFGSQTSARHFSDSAACAYQTWDHREQDKDSEHPLTRLQNALAEVQRCASPDDGAFAANSKGSSSFGDDSQAARSLSVLEKVSRFERRERAGKHRSHSTSHIPSRATHLQMSEKGRSTPCGADDLRKMLERSTNGTKAQRTMSYRGISSDLMKYRAPADPSSALQRSRSSFQLEGSREADSGWKQDVQEMLGSMQDTPHSRDAQPKALLSSSFRQKDLRSISPPPPAGSPPASPSSSQQPPFVPVKQHSLEKKGPKTMPKPQGVIITPPSSLLLTSPHTPKERHVVSPDVRGPSPPALPSVPPVGPAAPTRICGRRRLTADQKKRSYSEPEKMNEVGISDSETAALFRRGGETSVADRRRMFEPAAASPAGTRAPVNATSRPELRQLQHNALSEYVERKRGIKRGDGHRSAPRPRSAYFQPDNSNHAASPSCYSDTYSLSSASSLLSLQDSSAEQSLSSGERRLCSTLPPGADFRSLQSNLFYPGRVTTARPPALPTPSYSSAFLPERQHVTTQTPRSESVSKDPDLGPQQRSVAPQHSLGLFKLSGALQRAASAQSSKKSASAEDLLERFEGKLKSHQHYRSRSSPTTEMLTQDFPPGDVRMGDAFVSDTEDRPADVPASLRAVCPQPSHTSLSTVQPSGPSPTVANAPVARRERQRSCDCQRAHSASTLAASVGLPCPFSPPGTQGECGTEWPASDRLSLDAIAFSDIQQTSGEGAAAETRDRQAGRSLSGSSILEDNGRNTHRGRAYSLEMRGHDCKASSVTSSAPSPPSSCYSPIRHLSSLRISESSLLSTFEQQKSLESSSGLSQDDFDDVFLQSPAPPSLPPAMEDASITENLPTPPPPSPPPTFELETETGNQTVQSPSSDSSILIKTSPPRSPPLSPSSLPLPVPSLSPSPNPQPVTLPSSTAADVSLCLEYQPLPTRRRTPEEQRVELLAQHLVRQDPSLTPLLATWGSKTTVELMEEIFTNRKSQVHQRESSQLDDRVKMDGGTEATLDEEHNDLNAEKVELCDALRSSVAALQQEKEALCEEHRLHQALGASIEMLVQERLKTNERDKYNMFIGDLERIVNLLLSLCSRLSRIDRSLLALEATDLASRASKEKDGLHHKRSLLLRQTEDARELKENLDRRQQVVQAILTGYLTQSQLQDYRQFVSAKPSLLIRRRHLDDLIRQGEEQLEQLAESLPVELAEAGGWARASPLTRSSPMSCSSPLPPLLPPSMIPGPVHLVRSTTVTSL